MLAPIGAGRRRLAVDPPLLLTRKPQWKMMADRDGTMAEPAGWRKPHNPRSIGMAPPFDMVFR